MPNAPQPLTAPPKPNLNWDRPGTPASKDYDDIYFSVDGGLAETEAVFLRGCGLPEGWAGTDVFTIGELGFGSGLNFLAVWDLWARTARQAQRLHFVSVEAYPWTAEDLRKALAHWPSLKPYTDQLTAQWPGQVKGVHRLHFGNVHLTLFHMPVKDALGSVDAQIDAWFLDGFSPSKNPDMWSGDVFKALAKLSKPNAKLATFTVAGHVRKGLADAGFAPVKMPGFGRKRDRLEAIYTGTSKTLQNPENLKRPPVIIGGGIAGASIAKALSRRGISPILIEPEPDLISAASGNPRALVMPRLDLQDRPESRFFLSAYLYALAQYESSKTVCEKGVLHLAKSKSEAIRFDKLNTQMPLPPHHMRRVSQSGAEDISGRNIHLEHGGLYFTQAQTIDPKSLISQWTEACTRIKDRAASLTKQDEHWEICNPNGDILAVTDTVFLCIGANILDLITLDVRFTRGQICWGQTPDKPKSGLVYGGYCLPTEDGILLGATHKHVGAGPDTETHTHDTQENLDMYFDLCGHKLTAKGFKSRAATRVTTRDTLPISTKLHTGCYAVSGLGSRGFMMAPLLGEALVCDFLGEPSPLCTQTKIRFGSREKF